MKKILFIIFFFISFSTFAGDNLSGNYIYCDRIYNNEVHVDSFEFISSYQVNNIHITRHIPTKEEWATKMKSFYKMKHIYVTDLSNIYISFGESLESKGGPFKKIDRRTLEGFLVLSAIDEPDAIFYKKGRCKIIKKWSSKYKSFDEFVLDSARNARKEFKSKNQL